VVGDLTNSDKVMNSTFWVGVYPALGAEALSYLIEQITTFCRSH